MDGHGDAGHDGLLPALDLRMLGPLEAWRGGQQLSLGGQRQRSVLACLLLEPGHAVSSDRIVDTVWGARPPGGVQTTLQTYVFHLREALEPARVRGTASGVIATVPGGYRLEAATVIDAVRFEELVAAGRASLVGDPAAAAGLLKEALGLWRGEVLGDLTSMNGVVAPVAARLEESRAAATELWVEAEMALGHHDVLGALDDLVARYPLREHLAAMRMLALYRAGRQADALAAYRTLRQTLDDELGIQPSAEVETLHQRVLQQDPNLDLALPTPANVALETSPPPEAPAVAEGGPSGSRRRGGLSRRGWTAVTTIVLVAAAALVSTTFLARRADVTPLPPNSAGPVDARGLRGDAAMLDGAPSGLVWAADAVWATLESADAVVKIDPHSRAVVDTIRGVGGAPQAVATSGDDLWVAGYDENVLTRINIPTGVVVGKIPVGIEPAAVAAGPDGVWVANSGDNTVQHVNPATGKADPPIPVGGGPAALALYESTLWVANGRADTLTRLDARTGKRIAADIPVDSGPAALAVTATDVWVANEFGQSVSRVSLNPPKVKRIEVADGPSALAVLDDQVWVSNSYGGSLSRIDMATNAVQEFPVESAPRALTVVDGQVWTGSGAYANADHRGGTLVWAGPGVDFDGFDPAGGLFPQYGNLARVVYDGLVANRLSGGRAAFGLVPDLATRLPEPSDGGRTYVFSIRRNIRYSTGAIVLPSDFVRGMERTLHPDAGSSLPLDAIIGADSCRTPDDAERRCDLSHGMVPDDTNGLLTIHLSRPDPDLLAKLAALVVPTPSGTPAGALGATSLPGTGPYQVANVDHGSVTLTRNPYFSQWSFAAQPDGYPDVIAYRLAAADGAAVADVLAGRAHGAWTLGPPPISVTSQPDYLQPFDLLDMQYIFLNRALPPFDDVRVRRAFSSAIDRRVIAKLANAEVGCQMLPPRFPGFRAYCPHQSGPADGEYQGPDLVRARQLVAESGTAGTEITVHYGLAVPEQEGIARHAASVLASLGYRVNVRPFPDSPSTDYEAFFKSTQIIVPVGWLADYLRPGTFYDFVASCTAPNFIPNCNREIDAKATEARAAARNDPMGSLATWAEVDRLLVDDAAMVPTHTLVKKAVVSPSVRNIVVRPGFGPILDQLWVN